jgi:hypothetical protein
MFRNRIKSLIALPAMAGVLLLTACQASGGGTLPSASAGTCSNDAQSRATFGFNAAQNPNSTDITFVGNLTDRCAGVMLKGSGRLTPSAPPDLTPFQFNTPPQLNGCLLGTATYDSVNPAKPGSGTMNLVVCDVITGTGQATGQPTSDTADFIMISMPNLIIVGVDDTGPYKDYVNTGVLSTGRNQTPGVLTPGLGTGNIVVKQ